MLTHWQLDLQEVPRKRRGHRLSINERNMLYQQMKTERAEAKARRERLAQETGWPEGCWK